MKATMTAMQQADQLNQSAAREYEKVRSDATLSDEGRRIRIASTYRDVRDRVAALRATHQAEQAAQVSTLTRRAFGVPADPIEAMSYRDALGRAEAITDPRSAQIQLTRALHTGDRLMAQAIAQHAYDAGWSDVVNDYTAANPSAGTALGQLGDVQQQLSSSAARFREAGWFYVPKPPEIGHLQDFQIDGLADTAARQVTA